MIGGPRFSKSFRNHSWCAIGLGSVDVGCGIEISHAIEDASWIRRWHGRVGFLRDSTSRDANLQRRVHAIAVNACGAVNAAGRRRNETDENFSGLIRDECSIGTPANTEFFARHGNGEDIDVLVP